MSQGLTVNPGCSFWVDREASLKPLRPDEQKILGSEKIDQAVGAITTCPRFARTPLLPLTVIAEELKVANIWLKDESDRFGLQSFKALGGAYAVLAQVAQRAEVPLSLYDPLGDREQNTASAMTFCAATDGNHGRAVAAGAKLAGAHCVIFVHEGVKEVRKAALLTLGAEVTVVSGDYDDAVRACNVAAVENGWIKVADTAGPEEDWTTPGLVMQGYCVMVREALEQMAPERPSHIFVQAGVGGLAASVVAAVTEAGLGDVNVVIVEPKKAACLLEAVRQGAPVELQGDMETKMSMLSCGRVSEPAWGILSGRVRAYVAVEDADAIAAARRIRDFGNRVGGSIGVSGAAGLAGLCVVSQLEDLRRDLSLDQNSRILLFGTEADIESDLVRETES